MKDRRHLMFERNAQILSTGRYIPARRVDNAYFDERFDKPVGEWLVKNVGIESRHVMAADEVTSDLVVAAAKQALERAQVSAAEIDLLVVATDTPDYISPSTASVVQHKLGALHAGVFDVNAACAGWVSALDTAARYIATDVDINRVLVCGGYGMTRYLDWDDKKTATLFADGAGAVVLGATEDPGYLGGKLAADGQFHDALGIYTGGTARPATASNVAEFGPPTVRFVRKFPATFNADRWPRLIKETLAKSGSEVDDVALFIFTQLNARTIETVMDRLHAPMDRTHMVMDKWGYLGSACIPAAFDDAIEHSPLPSDSLVVFCATGGGLSMGCTAWRWSNTPALLPVTARSSAV